MSNAIQVFIVFLMAGGLWTGAVSANADDSSQDLASQQPTPTQPNEAEEIPVHLRTVEPEYFIGIVGTLTKIELLDHKLTGNLEPWVIASFADFDRRCLARCNEKGPACWKRCARERKEVDAIVLSNSCGFARADYENVHLAPAETQKLEFRNLAKFSIYTTIGEWCDLTRFAHFNGTGLMLGKWGDAYYEITSFPTAEGTADGYFLSPFEFSEERRQKIKQMFVPLVKEQRPCFNSKDLTANEAADMMKSEFAQRVKNDRLDICITYGLPISKVLSVYKQIGYF